MPPRPAARGALPVEPSDGRTLPAARPRVRLAHRVVGAFWLAGVLAAVVLAVAASLLARELTEAEAVDDLRRWASTVGRIVVAPAVAPGLGEGASEAHDALDRAVRADVLGDGIVRVKVWSEDGRIVYSDEPRLVGEQYRLGADELAALRSGLVEAEVSDLDKPENRFEVVHDRLLEVYLPVEAADGERYLFEAYATYAAVAAGTSELRRSFVLVVVGSLVVLALVQLPLAWTMAKRLEVAGRERQELLQRAVEASDLERRRVAADLHDGVVQVLVGASLGLAGAADRAERRGEQRAAAEMREGAGHVRGGVQELRSLLVEIYPPSLRTAGLPAAMRDMLAPLPARGIATDLDLPEHLDLPPDVEATLFRVAQEAVRNAVAHARAGHLLVRVEALRGRVVLTVQDDGQGFDPRAVPDRPGHLGLRLMHDLAAQQDGLLEVDAGPGSGTRVRLEVRSP